MELAIQFALGISYLLIGLSCLLHTEKWGEIMEDMRLDGERKALIVGSVALGLGGIITGFHPVWGGMEIIITIIGVIAIAEGAVYLLFPAMLPKVISFFTPAGSGLFRLFSLIAVGLGVLILYIWANNAGFLPAY